MNLFDLRVVLLSSIIMSSHFFPSPSHADEHHQKLIELMEYASPDGPGPHPTVVLVSGCDGFKSGAYNQPQEDLVKIGFATARVDFMASRGVGGCSSKPSVTRTARDILHVINHLSGLTSMDSSAINVLGWSAGGTAALKVASNIDDQTDVQIASVTAYYPGCLNILPWTHKVPVLMLLGGADIRNPAAVCTKLAGKSPDANIHFEVFEDATHAFDDPYFPDVGTASSGAMSYHKLAAEMAWNRLTQFLAR